jgi:hypothetical protein
MRKQGKPLDDSFVLGNLTKNRFEDLINSEKAAIYGSRLNDNVGNCKIFAFLYSQKKDSFDKIFDMTDPLSDKLK